MAYIEREKVIEVIKNFAKGAISDGQKALDPVDDIVLLCRAVDMILPADVAEVKHAEWLSNAQTDEYSCSECDGIAPVDSEKEEFYESNYCPNCGAMMDSAEKFHNNTEHSVDVNKMVQNQWISVNKQLPETYIEVLVCFKADGTNVIAFVNRFGKWKNASTDNFIESEITHWMPLPEPPKGVMKK